MALADSLPTHWDLRDPFGDLNLNLGLPVPEFQGHQPPVQHSLNHLHLSHPGQHVQVQDQSSRSLPGSAINSARESAANSTTGRIAWGEGADLCRRRTHSSRATPRTTPGKSKAKPGSDQRRAATPTLFGGRVQLFSAVHDTTPKCAVQMDSLVDRGKNNGPSSARSCSRRREPRPAPDFRQTEDWKKANESRLQKNEQLQELQRRKLLDRPGLMARCQSKFATTNEEALHRPCDIVNDQSCRGSDAGSVSWLDESSLWQGQHYDNNVSLDSRKQSQQADQQTPSCSSQRSRSREVSTQQHGHEHTALYNGQPCSHAAAQNAQATYGYPASGRLDEFAQCGSGPHVKEMPEAWPRRPPTPATARLDNIALLPQADISLLLWKLSRLRLDSTLQHLDTDLATPWLHESSVFPSATKFEFPPWPHDTL